MSDDQETESQEASPSQEDGEKKENKSNLPRGLGHSVGPGKFDVDVVDTGNGDTLMDKFKKVLNKKTEEEERQGSEKAPGSAPSPSMKATGHTPKKALTQGRNPTMDSSMMDASMMNEMTAITGGDKGPGLGEAASLEAGGGAAASSAVPTLAAGAAAGGTL